MAKEFNFKDIDLKVSNTKNDAELLTGEYLTGLSPNSDIESNSEVEHGEYVKFPDGETVKAIGNKHKPKIKIKSKDAYIEVDDPNSGIKTSLPNGTDVLTNTGKPNASQRKLINKAFGLDVSSKDTFSDVLDKFTKDLGLSDLNKKQADKFDELKKMLDKASDVSTTDVNKQYLSSIINDLEEEKKPLEAERSKMFDFLFALQEENKPASERSSNYKFGGTHVQKVMDKYGIDADMAFSILNKTGKDLPMFDGGGKIKFNFSSPNLYTKEEIQGIQPSTSFAYGDIPKESFRELSKSFKKELNDIGVKVISKGDDIEIIIPEGVSFKKQEQIFETFQKASRDVNLANENALNAMHKDGLVDDETIDDYKGFKKSEIHLTKEEIEALGPNATARDRAKAIDKKLGKFSAGRFIPQMKIVNNDDDLKTLSDNDIYSLKEVDIDSDVFKNLSPETQENIKKFKPYLDEHGGNFRLGLIDKEPEPASPGEPEEGEPEPAKKEKTPAKTGSIDDLVTRTPFKKHARLFFSPDQTPLPPSPMEAHLKGNIRLGRIDPLRIGTDAQMQELAEQRQFLADQIDSLPDNQRTGALMAFLANSQKTANQALQSANVINQQNYSKADFVNMQQADKEQMYGLNNALNFEQRQLTAKAKAEEEMKRYFDRLQTINVNDFKNQQRLNMLNSLFPQYDLDSFGMTVDYNGNTAFDAETLRRNAEMAKMLSIANNSGFTPPTIKGESAKVQSDKYTKEQADALIKAIYDNTIKDKN
jgi:DNA polymerase IIIc chi subunit